MMGLPIGVALSYLVSSQVAAKYGWRWAFVVAGVPGLLCTLAALFVREPARGANETTHRRHANTRRLAVPPGSRHAHAVLDHCLRRITQL